MQLRIDAWPFLACSALSLVALRLAPRQTALWIYVLLSVLIWGATIATPMGIALACCFLFLPFAAVRAKRNLSGWGKALLFLAQTAQLLWIRRYVDQIPLLNNLALPSTIVLIGVSYMLLRQIEWVLWIDADDETKVDALEYTAFVIGFITLLAGPILRYREFQRSFLRSTSSREVLIGALDRIVNGYIKAALIAPLLGDFTTTSWIASHPQNGWAFALCLLSYPLYVYLNFSGYCDVVIGLGRLANFEIPENFNRPFLATNIQEFWQRWHITFSSWIRVHVFFPLVRLFRTGPVRLPALAANAAAVTTTFLLVGAWHGPSPGFLIFGLMHAIGALAVVPYTALLEKVLGEHARARYEESTPLRWIRIGMCFSYLAASMLFFEREPSEVRELLSYAPW